MAVEQTLDKKVDGAVTDIVDINTEITDNKTDVDTYFKENFVKTWDLGLDDLDIVYLRTLLAMGNKEAAFDKLSTVWGKMSAEMDK